MPLAVSPQTMRRPTRLPYRPDEMRKPNFNINRERTCARRDDSHGDRAATPIASDRPRSPAVEHGAAGEQEKMQKYTCLMHPEVITDHPGNCPKCGMKLVPIKEKKRRTSDKSRAGAQHRTSSSDHLMHDGAEMAMSHHHHDSRRRCMRPSDARPRDANGNVDALHHRSR